MDSHKGLNLMGRQFLNDTELETWIQSSDSDTKLNFLVRHAYDTDKEIHALQKGQVSRKATAINGAGGGMLITGLLLTIQYLLRQLGWMN